MENFIKTKIYCFDGVYFLIPITNYESFLDDVKNVRINATTKEDFYSKWGELSKGNNILNLDVYIKG